MNQDHKFMHIAWFYLLGGGGEASTPNTIFSPPKHNYKLIIIHVFFFFHFNIDFFGFRFHQRSFLKA